jgi:hypothetical protein
LHNRHVVDERAVGDHDAGGVRRGVAREALELPRDVEQALSFGPAWRALAARGGVLERLAQRRARALRHLLGDRVDLVERDLQHAADVAHDAAARQRAERDDLADVRSPYLRARTR